MNIGHGIKGKRPLMITNLTSLSPGATGVHSRSSLSNRNHIQARRNVYMCVCVRTKKERKNTTTLRMTDDSRSPAVCCSIASEGIYIYNNIIHTVRFVFSLQAKRNAGPRCRCSFSLKKKNSTRGDKRSVVAGECWNFFVIHGFFA